MKKLVVTILFALSAFALMSGCSSDSTPASTTLAGTAATGAPIDGTVTVKDANGVEKDITTGTNGSFTLDVAGMSPPFLLKIMPSDGTATLYSYATEIGQTVNLTPTTNLAMFLASGNADLDAMYAAWDGTAVTATQVTTAEGTVRANLVTQMETANLDVASYDLFTTPFTADGTGIDAVLDNLSIVVDAVTGLFTFTDADGTDLVFDPDATPPAPPAAPAPDGAISIATITGKTHVLNGTYNTGCHGDGGGSTEEVLVISGNTWSYTNTGYTDGGCTAGASESTITATFVAAADSAITGWVDGSGSSVAGPDAADGSGAIGDTESFTSLTLTISASTGDFAGIPVNTTSPLFYVVDDTGTKAILYRDDDFENGSTLAGDFDPYTQL